MENPLTTTRKKLTQKQITELANFTDPGTILYVLGKSGWTIETAITNLVKIATDASKESVQLNAIKYLNTLVQDAMVRSGLMVTATRTMPGEDGSVTKFTGTMVSDSLKTQREIPGGESDTTTIDELVEIKDIDDGYTEEDNQETEEEQETNEADEERGDDGNDGSIDMSVSKLPEGKHADGGQFGGISIPSTDSDTIHLL